MTVRIKDSLYWLALVCGLASLWYILVAANGALFDHIALNANANLIYLPAALRIIYPLVFGSAGVGGIILGSYLSFPLEATDGFAHSVLLAILSGVAPLVAIALFKRMFKTRPDLADLTPTHLLTLATLCAASNAVILNLFLAVAGRLTQPIRQVVAIFIGDVTGAAIILYLSSFVLTFFISRRRL